MLWNAEGVRQHFHVITGLASAPFRMFPATIAGYADLADSTLRLLGLAAGPVVAASAVIGLGVCISEPQLRPALLLMAMPAGYLVTFIGVVGYVYDRFLLAVDPFHRAARLVRPRLGDCARFGGPSGGRR